MVYLEIKIQSIKKKCIDILNLNYNYRTDPFKKHEVTGLSVWLQEELQKKLIPSIILY